MSNNLQNIAKNIRKFLWVHHFTLFLVLAAGGVALGIYSLLDVINMPVSAQDTSSQSAITFDEPTMKRIYELQSSDQQQAFNVPTNQRTDPFLEQ